MKAIYSASERLNIANVMFTQLGGGWFMAITGAKKIECIYERDGKVTMRTNVGRNCKGVNRFEIAYNEERDLYELRFIHNRIGVDKVLAEYTDVYADELWYRFEQATGMVLARSRFCAAR